ncbi:MAG: aspartate/glutamate racemase family protein [bacterium]|jgi:aspartate racemase
MKTIGLIGGMSWESTSEYYRIINTTIRNHLSGLHSAKCILYSVDFHEVEKYQTRDDWDTIARILSQVAICLEKAGADFVLICSNTIHKVADEIQSYISVPILHIADVTADQIVQRSFTKVGLLGTRLTMEQDFYRDRLISKGIQVVVPELDDRKIIDRIIFDELCQGIVKPESKARYLEIVDRLRTKGAQAVILGCTEIGLLITQSDTKIPLFDTSYIHAYEAALLALP